MTDAHVAAVLELAKLALYAYLVPLVVRAGSEYFMKRLDVMGPIFQARADILAADARRIEMRRQDGLA